MHSCMFLSPFNASSDSLHISLTFASATLLGVGRRGRFSSHIFTPAFWSYWYLPIGFVLFYKVHSIQLGLLEKTWWIFSVLEGSPFNFCCPTFSRGGSKVVSGFSGRASDVFRKGGPKILASLLTFSAQAGVVFPLQYPRGSPILFPVCLSTEFFRDLDHPKGSRFSWMFSEVIRRTDPWLRATYL